MANTTFGGAEAAESANPYGAVISGNSPNTDETNTRETLPGEIGTPHERIQMIQIEVRNAIKAGLPVRYGNALSNGVPTLVISITNARAVMGMVNATFEYLGDVATVLPERYQKAQP